MTPAQRLRRALDNDKQDNLERAKHAFRGMCPEMMQQPHGQSGQTRQQILDGYLEDRREWMAASDLLDQLLAGR